MSELVAHTAHRTPHTTRYSYSVRSREQQTKTKWIKLYDQDVIIWERVNRLALFHHRRHAPKPIRFQLANCMSSRFFFLCTCSSAWPNHIDDWLLCAWFCTVNFWLFRIVGATSSATSSTVYGKNGQIIWTEADSKILNALIPFEFCLSVCVCRI